MLNLAAKVALSTVVIASTSWASAGPEPRAAGQRETGPMETIAGDLLPDIIVRESDLYDNDISTSGGRRLRLSNGTANVGDGPLHLYGVVPGNGDGTQDVMQRIFNSDGSFRDRLAGKFVYHPSHGHIHFEGWAVYRLREILPDDGVGAIVAEGSKTSFCIIDLQIYDDTLPGFGPGVYNSCGSTVQGLSVGWIDVYGKGLPDQDIDITGVADGQYWLESVADPDNLVQERDETNNVARIKVSIGGGPGTLDPDPYEPNQSWTEAQSRREGGPNSPNLGPAGPVTTIEGLTVHSATDDDYFRFYNPGTGGVADFVRITFQHNEGDIDMALLDANGGTLESSQGTGNVEEISMNGRARGWYGVHVYGWSGATTSNYNLTVNPAASTPPQITVTSPPAGDVALIHGLDTYEATWTASDPDGDPTWVTLYMAPNPVLDGNETLLPTSVNTPGAQGSFIINSAYLEPGTYYVIAQATDGGAASTAVSPGTVSFLEDCTVDFNGDDVLDFFDVSAFLAAFNGQQPDADLNDDGLYDFFDVSAFLVAFNAGCP